MMNYVGSISIIDRGDAPAQAVIDKNVRSLAQRVADETKDELDKVMDRVDNIYVSYEMSTQTMFENPRASPNVEYIEDIKELESIIKDTVKKKKYQQQVTIFIVGFQDVCSEKMQLLQQVNQFFLDNSKLDEEELVEEKPEIDLDECSNKINESLKTAEDLTKKLSDLNQDIIEWLVNWANTKASNKGKKRLEKNLETAKNDMMALQEKLLNLQTELEEKDEKFQQLAKQLDAKTQESLRYKTAAEVAKKSAQDNESHTSTLQNEISIRDDKIKELRQKLSRMEINLSESQFDNQLHQKRLDNKQMEAKHRLEALQEEVETKKIAVVEAEREMDRLHREQLLNLEQNHKQEINELKAEHQAELTKLTGKSYGDQSAGEDEHPTSKQESRPSTKDTKSSKRSEVKAKIPSRSPNRLAKEKSGARTPGTKEYAEASIQDEDGDHHKAFVQKSNEPSRQPTRQSKNLQPVEEIVNFEDVFELEDEESWASVPAPHVPGRFSQYRKLSTTKVKELQDQLNITLTKTHRKVNSLKSQFTEHKKKWESERKVLIEQVEQAQKLQTEAEKEADAAMTQLEEFINEQEKLEDEEETKRQEVLKAMSRPGTVGPTTPTIAEPTGQKEEVKDEEIAIDSSDQELKKLMQQTDDAKAPHDSEKDGHLSDAESRTGTAMTYDSGASQLAPWLTPIGVVKKAPANDGYKSSSESPSDPFSRLTSAADAEIRQIVPAEELLAMEDGRISQKLPQIEDAKSRSASRQDLLKSRQSSKFSNGLKSRSSTKLPRIYTSVHIDEEEEEGSMQQSESDEDSETAEQLAPWMTPAGMKKKQKSARSRSRSPRSQMSHKSVSGEVEVEPEAAIIRSGSSKALVDSKSLSKSTSRGTEGQKSVSPRILDGDHDDSRSRSRSVSKDPERQSSRSSRRLGDQEEQTRPRSSTEEKSQIKEKIRSKSQLKAADDLHSSEADAESHVNNQVEEMNNASEKSKFDGANLEPRQKIESLKERPRTSIGLEQRERSQTHVQRSRSTVEKSEFIKEQSKVSRRSKTAFKKSNIPEADAESHVKHQAEEMNNVSEKSKFDGANLEPRQRTVSLKERPRTSIGLEQRERSQTHTQRSRSTVEKSEFIKEQSKVLKRSKTSFEKPNIPEVKPRSFRSERDEEAQKDSGIEQSEVSDAQSDKIPVQERTRTMLSRSARSRPSPTKSHQEPKTMTVAKAPDNLESSDDPSHMIQLKSRSKFVKSRMDENGNEGTVEYLDDGKQSESRIRPFSHKNTFVQDNNEVTLELPSNASPSKSHSKSVKSRSDEDRSRIEFLDDGVPSRNKTKESLQGNEKSPELTGESAPIDLNSAMSGDENVFEEELNLPGLSTARGESVTDDMKMSRTSHQRSRMDSDIAEKDFRKSKLSSEFADRDSVRSGAQMVLGKHNDEVRHTIQSERRPSVTTNSTVSPRKMMVVTVDVLAGSEVQASRTSGAISAPPAVEPDENTQQMKEPDTVREDYESRPVSPDRMRTATPSTNSSITEEPPSATPKKAFSTPRPPTVSPPSLRLSSSSSSTMSEVDLYLDEGVDLDLAPTQSDALNNLKQMMTEEDLTMEQEKTLESLRSAIKSVTNSRALKDVQLERTMTILSLASQIARESIELDIAPDSIFNSFANIDSRAMSVMTDSRSGKRLSSGTENMLKSGYSTRKEPVIIEQHTDRADSEQTDVPFNIVIEKSRTHSKVKPDISQERSTRPREHAASKQRQPSAAKERKKKEGKEKERQRESSSLAMSGSLDIDTISSRRMDSFSDSLPRTVPSAEWQEMSLDEPISPIKVVVQNSTHELRKELVTRGTQSELSGNDLKVIGKGLFASSPKKKRPITKEEMLYGETSMHVGPTGRETEHDIMTMDEASFSSSGSDQQLSEKKESSLSLPTDPFKDSPLPQTPKSVTRSSRILTPNTSSNRRSRSKSQVSLDGEAGQQSSSRQVSGTITPYQQVAVYTPITPAESVTSITRPLSPESFQAEPSFLTTSTSHQVLVTTPTPDRTAPNSPVPRPVSISSVHATFDLPPPPELCKSTQTEPLKWIEMTKIEHEPVVGKTEDEIRVSSAKSRASLRNQFKTRLEETRTVVEDRRAKSPAISIPSQKSLEDDQLIIDDDDDDLPIPDDMKVEDVIVTEDNLDAGTSPPPLPKPGQHAETQVSRATSKQSVNLAEHPVVQEYLKTYRGVHNFKDAISRLLEDKDQMSASQILADLDTVPFDQSMKVQPQLENMTDNVYYVLNEVSQVVNSIIHNDRGPVVSSLMMGMSRDPTQRSMIRERSSESVDVRQGTQQSQRSVKVGPSPSVDRQQYKDLQEKYETLQGQMSEEARKYEEQLRHNTVVMMEMQDTINELQRELSALGKTARQPLSDEVSTPGGGSQNAESAVMFTRLDSDRNAKIMKKAVIEEKLDPGSYKEAMVQMDEYITLPAQRLAHLVRKYVHHCRMKDIEENVKKSKSLNENVFNILDKMEELQNQRAKRWADRMDEMGMERLRIASQLMETLDTIEQQSGIFLIKPMYSYRGREPKEHYAGKISRPFRPTRALSPLRDVQSAYAPAPTPASNVRAMVRAQEKAPEAPQISQEQPPAAVRLEPQRPLEGDSSGLMGASVNWVGTQPKATWSMSDSQPRGDGSLMGANLNTPRILELDINRMMIGQNTISAQIGSPGISNDRLVNASNSNLRSYMTVNRPAVAPSGSAKERPLSGSRLQESPTPRSSPVVTSSSKGVHIPNDQFSSTPPLPPIGSGTLQGRVTPKGSRGRQSPRAPSQSPPGSSLRQTPPNTAIDIEIIPTMKG